MHFTEYDELLLAIAAAQLSVEHETANPMVAEHAERLMGDILDAHDATPGEAVAVVFDH